MKSEQEIKDELVEAYELKEVFYDNEQFGKMNKLQGYIEGLQFARGYNNSCRDYMLEE